MAIQHSVHNIGAFRNANIQSYCWSLCFVSDNIGKIKYSILFAFLSHICTVKITDITTITVIVKLYKQPVSTVTM